MNSKSYKLFYDNLIVFITALIPVVFWQPFFDPFGPAQLMVLRVFVPLAFFFYFLSFIKAPSVEIKVNPVVIILLLYVLACFVSLFYSINRQISFKYIYEITLAIAGGWLIYSAGGRKGMEKVFVIIIVFHTIIASYGIMQHFDADIFKWNTNFAGRPLGTIGNPDFFAGELLISIFLTLSYIIFGKKYRALLGIAAIIQLLCFIYAKVAGAYIGFAAGAAALVIIALLKFKPSGKKMALGALAVVVAGIILLPFIYSKSGKFIEEKKHSLRDRMLMWEASVLMFKDSPVIGKGFGNYRLYYPKFQGELLNDPKNNNYDYVVTWMPHQNYLLIMAETGIAGIVLFLAAVFAGFYFLAKSLKSEINPYNASIASALIALLWASFFNTFYNVPSTMLFFFLFLIAAAGINGKGRVLILKNPGIKIVCAAGLVLFVYSAVADGKTITASVYLKKANSLTRQKLLDKAIPMHERVMQLGPVELCPQTDVAQFYYAAEAYREAGMLAKAYELYGKDLKLNPYCPEVNNMYGALAGQLGNIDLSIAHLKTAVFTAPHYETAYTNLATAYMVKGDKESAKAILEQFVEKNGTNERIEILIKAAGN